MIGHKNYHEHLSHDEVIPLLREIPGRELFKNICLIVCPWRNLGITSPPEIVFYSSHGEFSLGICGPNGEVGRMDSIVEIHPPDLCGNSYCTIGIEIKTDVKDLEKDRKLSGKYLESRMCDYYFLVTISDELALRGCVKYAGNPAIGVASLASGKVFKIPTRQEVPEEKREKYREQLCRRPYLKEGSPFHKYYIQDDDYVMLLLRGEHQVSPIMRVVRD